MRYISLFSGIEAASVAWEHLGWTPVAFSEIEPFPSKVLAHRWPGVPNLGDMTAVDWLSYRGKADIVIGGSPCQAFSVAGLRKSLDDDRGNLTLAYMRAIHAIRPKFFVWENVPGVLNTKDNAFGCFLAGLAGEDAPLTPGGKEGKWDNAGLVSGKEYSMAYRVLDAQHLGVPQRRRRVFLVGHLGDWKPAAKVLFECEGVHRNPKKGRKAGKGTSSPADAGTDGRSGKRPDGVTAALTATGVGTCGADDNQAQAGHVVPVAVDFRNLKVGETAGTLQAKKTAGYSLNYQPGVLTEEEAAYALTGFGNFQKTKPTLRANGGDQGGGSEALVAKDPDIAHTLSASYDASEDGCGRGTPLVPAEKPIAFSSKDHGADASDIAPTLRAGGHNESHPNAGVPPAVVIPIDMRQASRGEKMTNSGRSDNPMSGSPGTGIGHDGDPCPTLGAEGHKPAVFTVNMQGAKGMCCVGKDDKSPTLNAMHGYDMHAVCYEDRTNSHCAVCLEPLRGMEEVACLGPARCLDCPVGVIPKAVCFQQNTRDEVRLFGGDGQTAGALMAEPGMKQQNYICETAEPIPFDTTQLTSKLNRSAPKPGDPCHPLAAGAHPPAIGFYHTNRNPDDGNYEEKSPTIKVGSGGGGGNPPAVVYDMRGRGDGKVAPTLCTDHASRPSDFCPVIVGEEKEPLIFDPLNNKADDKCTTLGTNCGQSTGRSLAVTEEDPKAFQQNQMGEIRVGDKVGTLNTNSNPSGRNTPMVFSLMPQNSGKDFKAREVEVVQPLMAAGPGGGNQGGDVIIQPDPTMSVQDAVTPKVGGETAFTLTTPSPSGGGHPQAVLSRACVRRLTPRECERLQDFDDDYTLIPGWGQKNIGPTSMADHLEVVSYLIQSGYSQEEAEALAKTPDGPRYKALGNSMATCCIAWIGEGIQLVMDEEVREAKP